MKHHDVSNVTVSKSELRLTIDGEDWVFQLADVSRLITEAGDVERGVWDGPSGRKWSA